MKDEEMISRSVELALALHKGQTRRGGKTPYVIHPIRVGFILQGLGVDAETVCAGLLHDTIEDTEATWDTLKLVVSERVADMVVSLTQDKRQPRAQRKKAALEALAHAPEAVRLVKLADRLDNVREAWKSGWATERMQAYANESRQVLAAAGSAHAQLAEALGEAIDTLDALIARSAPETPDE